MSWKKKHAKRNRPKTEEDIASRINQRVRMMSWTVGPRCPTCGRTKAAARHQTSDRREVNRSVRTGKFTLRRERHGTGYQGTPLCRNILTCMDPFHQPELPSPPRGRIVHVPEAAEMKRERHRALQGRDRR